MAVCEIPVGGATFVTPVFRRENGWDLCRWVSMEKNVCLHIALLKCLET